MSDTNFSKWVNQGVKKEVEPARARPHAAIITLKIEVRELDGKGIIGESVVGNGRLSKFGIRDKARIMVKGATEAECILKVKNLLENLNEKP
tara:strand:+ start:77 stop:352 length:276 start_codon:yes stop_codon:yes gene_type:complete